MENYDKIQWSPFVLKETGHTETQEQTVIPANKSNKRKRKRIEPLENQFDSYIRRDTDIENELKILKRNQQLILEKLDRLTNLMDNNKSSLSNASLLKPTLPGSSVDECIHGEVLQENLKVLVRDMDLSNGLILDEMLQDNALTDNEAQEIRELPRPNKTRKLATILGRKNKSIFKDFLTLIAGKEFYPHIAEVLRQSYEKKLKAQDKHPQCVRCFIINKVNINHVVDHLCENHVISLHDMGYIINGDSRDVHQFWSDIFIKMRHPVYGESCVSVFADSLKEHYPHIAKRIRSQHSLKCLCASTVLSYPSGSADNVSELSTTTTVILESITQEQLSSNQSNDSVGDSSDISTSTVIPEPKPETREWVQKHHSLNEENKETENLTNSAHLNHLKFNNFQIPLSRRGKSWDEDFQRTRIKQNTAALFNRDYTLSTKSSAHSQIERINTLPEGLAGQLNDESKYYIFKRPIKWGYR